MRSNSSPTHLVDFVQHGVGLLESVLCCQAQGPQLSRLDLCVVHIVFDVSVRNRAGKSEDLCTSTLELRARAQGGRKQTESEILVWA